MNKYFNTYNKRINRLNIILVFFGLFILSEYFTLQFKTNSNIEKIIGPNESAYIPLGVKHRLSNPFKIPLTLIEIQSGSYLGEDDIERFEDKYGR